MRRFSLVILVLLLCTAGTVMAAKPSKGSFDEYSQAVRSYFDDYYGMGGTDYPILFDEKEYPWLAVQVPGASFVQAYGKFRAPAVTGSFIFWKGRAYVMPDEFNGFTKDAHLRISSEEDALALATLYAGGWEPSGAYGVPAAQVVSNPREIPGKSGKVPPGREGKITPPGIAKQVDGYTVVLYSWTEVGGFLREWHLTVTGKGEVTGSSELLASHVGDSYGEGAVAERSPPASGDSGGGPVLQSMGDGEHTRNVDIDGTTRFVIHYRHEDFVTTDAHIPPDGTVDQVVGWVDGAARNAWQRFIKVDTFDIPPDDDGATDIYIWNDSVSWGPLSASPGLGAFWNMIGNDQYIYALNNPIGWFSNPGFNTFWPSFQEAQDAIVGHEFMHGVQSGYKVGGCIDWLHEGTARFSQTLLTPGGEFWQNSALAGLPAGTYTQGDAHRGHYIKDSTFYVRGSDQALSGWGYKGCLFWRYTYEHQGAAGGDITPLKKIYNKIKADGACGATFAAEVSQVDAALGTTAMDFPAFAAANYLEFSPYGFARDGEFYQNVDRYYADVTRSNIAGPYPKTDSYTVNSFATRYFDIDAGSIRRLRISFDGSDAGSFAVRAFRGQGTSATTLPIILDGAKAGSIIVENADTADVVGLMVAGLDTASARSFSVTLEDANTPPVAEAGGAYAASEGSAVTLDGSGSTDADGDPLQYRWDVNDDGTWEIGWNTQATVAYTYADDFAGLARLEVSDGLATASDTARVTITNKEPEVHAGPDGTIYEGDTFTQAGSFSDPGADIWSATVNYGDGSGVKSLALPGKTFTLSHTYADNLPGNAPYTVTVTVTDDDGGTGTDDVLVTVMNRPPVVDAGPDATINEGDTFTRAGSFTDAGADIWSATVNYGDGSGVKSLTLSGKTFTLSHTYADNLPGNAPYTVTVTVTDDDGGVGSDQILVTVLNVNPTVTGLSKPNSHFILPVVHTVTFTGTFTDPGWLDTHTATWDFGDGSVPVTIGTTEENLPPDATGTSVKDHAFPAPGDYTVTLTVTDKDSGSGTRTLGVHVADAAEAKHILAAYIQGLPDNAFKGKADERKGAFANKFAALDAMITAKAWNGFTSSLVNDVRDKADGHVDGKANDDWIKEKDPQVEICTMINDIVAYVKTLR